MGIAWTLAADRLDDPQEIEAILFRTPFMFTNFLCKIVPATFLVALAIQLVMPGARFVNRLKFATVSIVIAATLFALLLWDPFHAWRWFMS